MSLLTVPNQNLADGAEFRKYFQTKNDMATLGILYGNNAYREEDNTRVYHFTMTVDLYDIQFLKPSHWSMTLG